MAVSRFLSTTSSALQTPELPLSPRHIWIKEGSAARRPENRRPAYV